ncbi:MAG: hypothetical protein KDC32_02875 [Saprospiraceae bacterium]|nr:hypothetical protein [Saprospiraceae bacterium]MCB0679892.1 hypothetical protein [Saprospiraceae bacterium]
MKRTIYLLLLTATLFAFQKITREEVRQQRLQEKIDNYRSLVQRKCRQSVLDSASVIVDSILITQAKARKDSALARPPKPDKPLQPERRLPIDSSAIHPLFFDDSTFFPVDTGR